MLMATIGLGRTHTGRRLLLLSKWLIGDKPVISRNIPPTSTKINPILGKHPNIGRVNNYFAASIPINVAISALLPSKYRPLWQYVRLGVQISLVSYNRSVGIGIEF